ncbi:MAG: tetratricopeptide repeat protein [Gammaproteobacteria bacterium]|nr:tetratricopeptide repeat protein [Gammaproteobacteria bacterium]
MMSLIMLSTLLYAKKPPQIIELAVPGETKEETRRIHIIPYDKKMYDLAYKVYLYNANVEDAYAIVSAAVQQTNHDLPENRIWRNRFAEIAIWHRNINLAAKQYLFLVTEDHDQEALRKGIDLSKRTQSDFFLMKFLQIAFQENPHNESISRDMIDTWLRLGTAEKAKTFLKQNKTNFSDAFYYLNEARISNVESRLDAQLAALKKYSDQYKMTPRVALDQARIYTAHYQFQKAADAMFSAKENTSSLKTKKETLIFWETYADIAITTNHPEQELFAYQQLLKQKLYSEKLYINLIDLTAPINPKLAFDYAKQAKKIFPDSLTATINIFARSIQSQAWREFPDLDKSISATNRKMLKYEPAYGETKANYLQELGLHDAAVQVFMNTINTIKNNSYLKADFLYFLVQTRDLQRLAIVLPMWRQLTASNELLWGGYASGATQLNQRAETLFALQSLYDKFPNYKDDPYWMIYFKDILENSNHPAQAWAMVHNAWSLYLPLLNKQQQPPNYIQLLNYIKLSIQEGSGDVNRNALYHMQKFENQDSELLMLSWALDINNVALADGIYSYYKFLGHLPPSWAVLSLAIQHEDRYLMHDVLMKPSRNVSSTPDKITSYRDKVHAAREIDAKPLAEQTAYESLELHPRDSNLYDNYFENMMVTQGSNVSDSLETYQYAAAEGPRNIARLPYRFTPSLKVEPYHFIWFPRQVGGDTTTTINTSIALSTQEITNIPSQDDREGVKLTWARNRGLLALTVGRRAELNTFATFRLQREYRMSHDFNTELDLGVHQVSEDSLGLLVGGVKNYLKFSGNYQMSAHDTLLMDYSQNFFYTQDGKHVGDGFQYTLNFEHRINQSYPDWKIGFYGYGATYFNETQQLTGSILTIIPPGVPQTASFLLPREFIEYGVRLSFGQTLEKEYKHDWRPFASLTLSQNSIIGFGKIYNFGLTGSVFGRDKLLLYYNQGTNQGAGIQIQRLAKITYFLYF